MQRVTFNKWQAHGMGQHLPDRAFAAAADTHHYNSVGLHDGGSPQTLARCGVKDMRFVSLHGQVDHIVGLG